MSMEPEITFSYEGRNLILSIETTAAYKAGDTAVEAHVRDLAQRRANAQGAPCEVFTHDQADYLFTYMPEKTPQ